MSTSYLTDDLLECQLDRFGLKLQAIDGYTDWLIIDKANRTVFQGTSDRCSDFVRGMTYATNRLGLVPITDD